MADEDFATLFSMRGARSAGHERRRRADRVADARARTATRCSFTVGGENELMPIMLDRHVAGHGRRAPRHLQRRRRRRGRGVPRGRRARRGSRTPRASRSSMLRALAPDGIEVYNLHANIDPDIRADYLGLDAVAARSPRRSSSPTRNPGHPEPDLAMLAFLSPNQPAIDDVGRRCSARAAGSPVTAGSDAHENAIPIPLADGERGDSYRRVLRWFGNIVLVADPRDPGADRGRAARPAACSPCSRCSARRSASTSARRRRRHGPIELGEHRPARGGRDADRRAADGARARSVAAGSRRSAPQVFWIETPTGAVTELVAGDGRRSSTCTSARPAPTASRCPIVPRHLGPVPRRSRPRPGRAGAPVDLREPDLRAVIHRVIAPDRRRCYLQSVRWLPLCSLLLLGGCCPAAAAAGTAAASATSISDCGAGEVCARDELCCAGGRRPCAR